MLQPAAVHRLMGTGAVPVAVRLPDGLVLRGHEWPRNGPAAVFVHDLGDDLDAWGPLTAQVAAQGLRVISMELRGHGLSDGDPEPAALREDMTAMLGEITASFGPAALVSYGSVTETMLFLDGGCGAPVQVMISPLPQAPKSIDWRRTRPAMRLVLRGALNREAGRQAGFIYPRMRGQKLEVTGASDESGPALLADQPRLAEHMMMFLRRYLTPYHLSWISGRAEQIEAARAGRPPNAAERSRGRNPGKRRFPDMAVVDAHLHLFKARSGAYPRLVFDGMAPSEREEPAEELLEAMDGAGVDHAVVIPLSARDEYLAELLAAHPGRFAGVGVYDSEAADGAGQVARRAEQAGIQGLRFYGFGGEAGQAPESLEVFPVLEAMRELGMKVWFYGSPGQVRLLDGAMKLLPGLKVVLNHLGFCPDIWMELTVDEHRRPRFDIPLPPDSLELIEQLAADHPDDLYVHASGQYAFTRTPYPHPDLQEVVDRIYAAFGARRMLNASDWPWIKENPGYGAVLSLVDRYLPGLTPEERSAVRGGTACSLFDF